MLRRAGLAAAFGLALAAAPAAGGVLTAPPSAAPSAAAPAAPAVPALVRWEYKVLNYNRVAMFGDSDADMRLLGLQGWELVSSVYDPNARTIVCFYKRPLGAK